MFSILTTAFIAQIVALLVVAYASDEKAVALMRALKPLAFGWVAVVMAIAYQIATTKVDVSWDIIWAAAIGVATYVLHRALVAACNRTVAKAKK